MFTVRVQVLISRDGVCENVLKIKPPLVFSLTDADEMVTAMRNACEELITCLENVDLENAELMKATAPGRSEAETYFDRLFLERMPAALCDPKC